MKDVIMSCLVRAVDEYDAMAKLWLVEETLKKIATDQVEAQYM